MNLTARAFVLGARLVPRLPGWLSAAVFRLVADVCSLTGLGGVRQLERNLSRAAPWARGRRLRRLTRDGMRSYMRYYQEALRLPAETPARLGQAVRVINDAHVREHLRGDRPVVMALGHSGNWDLAGAWSGQFLAPVLTVAERLEPPEVFQEFLELREHLGMTIVPLDSGGSTFRSLLRLTGGRQIVPLLADRDLSRQGVEVDLFGARARVAAGPATLALATGAPLVAVRISYERLRGARRQAAGRRWGLVVDFSDPIPVPEGRTTAESVEIMTQGWLDALAQGIATQPQDWHMLQPVFVDDLDPDRLVDVPGARG
ncbi:MAG TPA: phosphatidylinositol mannoside acyltransferase [Actinomycetaceae bacterium]|nr:phosphatidylinositol mannoside acyltransferase [Actinomycetaceae bacterium]